MQSNNTQYSQKEHKHCLKEQKVEELYQATLIKLKEQSTQDGLQIINDFLQLFPSNGKALTIRGELFLKQNLNDYALNDLNQAIELGSFNEVTLYNRATVFQRKKMFKESQEDCEKAIQINPNYGLAYMRIGTIMLAKGQFHEALKYYNKAIEVDERCYFAYIANLMNKIQVFRQQLTEKLSREFHFINISEGKIQIKQHLYNFFTKPLWSALNKKKIEKSSNKELIYQYQNSINQKKCSLDNQVVYKPTLLKDIQNLDEVNIMDQKKHQFQEKYQTLSRFNQKNQKVLAFK
ncbi:unnamed protein product [Paramecium octaurelia]|uniref:Tetratricopeptide repeat protein n=1 Tax=Paramecium octaurelia TaxID=43137 RepID=A0A8S1YJQ2_PAROT|nr:unnamed protein product [Paramecium octaurelia]